MIGASCILNAILSNATPLVSSTGVLLQMCSLDVITVFFSFLNHKKLQHGLKESCNSFHKLSSSTPHDRSKEIYTEYQWNTPLNLVVKELWLKYIQKVEKYTLWWQTVQLWRRTVSKWPLTYFWLFCTDISCCLSLRHGRLHTDRTASQASLSSVLKRNSNEWLPGRPWIQKVSSKVKRYSNL